MHAFHIEMWTHFFGVSCIRILPCAVVTAVANPTRFFLVGFYEEGNSGQEFSFGGSEGGIGFNQLLQYPLLFGGIFSKGVKIFSEVIS